MDNSVIISGSIETGCQIYGNIIKILLKLARLITFVQTYLY
jgi:hypothetical protein